MLKLRNVSFSIEGKKLFEDTSAVIPTGHKVGIVGRNGSGKTTLFRLIRGEWGLDGGKIDYPSHFRVGGVDQEAPASDASLLDTVLAADVERRQLMAEAQTATEPDRIADIHTRLTDIDAYSAEARAASILSGLGFSSLAQAKACREFSGGWRMRVALAAVLFSQPDLLLLDEPTNYLDLEGAIWLNAFLARYQRTALVISHDRQLLNRSVTGILHLTDHKLAYYAGRYDQFDTERRMKLEQRQSMARKQESQRKHIQSFVDRFRYKASKARQAQSRLRQLEKMEPILALSERAVCPFHFPTPKELPPPLMVLENVVAGYDNKPVLRNLNLRLDPDDRIALLGANGEGKSTLSKLFAGRLQPLSGGIVKSSKLRTGFFSQHQLDELVEGDSPYQHMQRLRPKELPTKLRARLGGAGLNADIVNNPVESLSGGQKARLLMAMAAIDAPHILILDEPTNHLDIESREALVHALNAYEGTVILVSHDSHLVETVADQLWIVHDGLVFSFDGDISDYHRQVLNRCSDVGVTTKRKKSRPAKKTGTKLQSHGRERRQTLSQLRAEVKKLEKDNEMFAAKRKKIEAEMAKPGFYNGENKEMIAHFSIKLSKIDAALVKAEQDWLAAEEALDAAQ